MTKHYAENGTWGAILRRPWLWLAVAAALLVVTLKPWDEARQREGATIAPDYYVELSQLSFTEILDSPRTFGFPYLLKGIRALTPSYAALPYYHVALHVLAVFVFYGGLRAIGIGGWLAAACAASLLPANTLCDCVWFLMPDPSALSLAVLTVGALLAAAGRPGNVLAWVGLTVGLLLTYQTRPAYLFLIGLLPVLGFLVHGMAAPRPRWRRQWKPVALGLLAACLLPFLAFCSLRWFLFNHFGLVAFGGNATIGIAGWFLTEDMVPQLPEEVQPLARAIIARRAEVMPDWQLPVTPAGSLDPEIFETLQIEEVNGRFNQMIWSVAMTAAEGLYTDQVTLNRRLETLSLAIFKARPRLYAGWISQVLRRGPRLMVMHNYVLRRVVGPLLLLLLAAGHGLYVFRRWRTGPAEAVRPPAPARDYAFALNSLLLIGAGFALAKLLLLSLVTGPVLRYLDASGVFLPCIGVVVLFAGCERLRRQLRLAVPAEVPGEAKLKELGMKELV